MARRKTKARLYWRERGGSRRAYGDFRDYEDVGGKREPLIPVGEKMATTDQDVAQLLIAERVRVLEAKRRGRALHGERKATTLGAFAREHLIAKAKSGRWTEPWLEVVEAHLDRALAFFTRDRDLRAITVADVRAYVSYLQQLSNGRSGTMSGGTVRHHLNAVSNLYRRAASEGYVEPGYNPIAALMEKPSGRRQEAKWLEVHEAALFLEAARTYRPKESHEATATTCAYPLIATYLLTGGRTSEVLGLELDDVSFERQTVTFRPNKWRRLKTATSFRVVHLWPQLEAILRAYLKGPHRPTGELLFPSARGGREIMITDMRKLLDHIAARAGFLQPVLDPATDKQRYKAGALMWEGQFIRTRMFRHTYCSARLQTLDHGAPVSIYTVGKELGHGGEALVKRVYGHLGTVRHRSEVVEYRVEQHQKQLKDRLAAMT